MADGKWSKDPKVRAFAAQWLVEKRLTVIREKMPPEVFEDWAKSLDLLLAPMEQVARYG